MSPNQCHNITSMISKVTFMTSITYILYTGFTQSVIWILRCYSRFRLIFCVKYYIHFLWYIHLYTYFLKYYEDNGLDIYYTSRRLQLEYRLEFLDHAKRFRFNYVSSKSNSCHQIVCLSVSYTCRKSQKSKSTTKLNFTLKL